MQHWHVVLAVWMAACCTVSFAFFLLGLAWWFHGKQTSKIIYFHVPPYLFTYFCLSFFLLFVSHFSSVFCLICLPSAIAFHPWVCGLQPLQPSGLQQPPAGRELRRLQQGNELMEGGNGYDLGNEGGGSQVWGNGGKTWALKRLKVELMQRLLGWRWWLEKRLIMLINGIRCGIVLL